MHHVLHGSCMYGVCFVHVSFDVLVYRYVLMRLMRGSLRALGWFDNLWIVDQVGLLSAVSGAKLLRQDPRQERQRVLRRLVGLKEKGAGVAQLHFIGTPTPACRSAVTRCLQPTIARPARSLYLRLSV